MKVKVLQEELREGLGVVTRFVSSRVQLPILSNVLLEGKGARLYLSATNLEMSVSLSIGAEVKEEGVITIPARVLVDLVSQLSAGQMSLESKGESVKIFSGGFSASLLGMGSSDFPDLPKSVGKDSVKLDVNKLVDGLTKVYFSVSKDETRPVLTGVLLEFGVGKLCLVATDGFRLSRKYLAFKGDGGRKVILPRGVIGEVMRVVKGEGILDYWFDKKENQVVFGYENLVFSSRVLQGEFPDYERIVPKTSSISVECDKEELLSAVKTAGVLARDSSNMIKIVLENGKMFVKSESSSAGSQATEVEAKISGVKESFEIGFNYKFVEEFLLSMTGGVVSIGLDDPNAACVFEDTGDKDYLHIIMPVRTGS